MKMSERIRERRKALGLTQGDLAQKLGLQTSAVAKYENGRVENIKRSVILKMAQVLECSPSYLMGIDETDDAIGSDTYNFPVSRFERTLITTYRASDQLTKDMVNRILHLDEPAEQDKMA